MRIHPFMTPINFLARFVPLLSKILQNTKKYVSMSTTELCSDWFIGYYALGPDKFSVKTISSNNFSSERVDSEGLHGR